MFLPAGRARAYLINDDAVASHVREHAIGQLATGTLVLNRDGTTTAWNRDRTKDLAKLSSIRRSETQDRRSGQAKVRWSQMSVIVRGKNANRPYTVRFWVDGKQRERSFRTRRKADEDALLSGARATDGSGARESTGHSARRPPAQECARRGSVTTRTGQTLSDRWR